jgi:hypothetical protein
VGIGVDAEGEILDFGVLLLLLLDIGALGKQVQPKESRREQGDPCGTPSRQVTGWREALCKAI